MAETVPDEQTIEIIRVLIPDAEAAFDGKTLFTDDEIKLYYAAGRGHPLRAAGLAQIAIGNSEAMISKVIKTQDLSTNGAQVADAFRKSGELLMKRADDEELADNGFYANIIDYGWGDRPELTEWNWSWYR